MSKPNKNIPSDTYSTWTI